MEIPKTFLGYKREDGRTGTRNHVIILPVDDISNACAEAVANNIKGTIALPHSYGRLQFGADLELHFRTMIGTGKNPNVAAVIVVGIEPKWTKRIVDAIAVTGKPVEGFSIEGVGDIDTIAEVFEPPISPMASDVKEFKEEVVVSQSKLQPQWKVNGACAAHHIEVVFVRIELIKPDPANGAQACGQRSDGVRLWTQTKNMRSARHRMISFQRWRSMTNQALQKVQDTGKLPR